MKSTMNDEMYGDLPVGLSRIDLKPRDPAFSTSTFTSPPTP